MKVKKNHRRGPEWIARQLELARHYISNACIENEDAGKCTLELKGGGKVTIEEVCQWLDYAREQWKENGPKAEAMKTLNEHLQNKFGAQKHN